MARSFGFDSDLSGVWVTVEREPLCSGCRSGDDVDAEINRLKVDLDDVAAQMKAEIAKQDGQFSGLDPVPEA